MLKFALETITKLQAARSSYAGPWLVVALLMTCLWTAPQVVLSATDGTQVSSVGSPAITGSGTGDASSSTSTGTSSAPKNIPQAAPLDDGNAKPPAAPKEKPLYVEQRKIPTDRSSDGFFSEEDFSNNAAIDKKGYAKPPVHANDKVLVKVFIEVPHNYLPINEFTAYPYPMRPPNAKLPKLLPMTAEGGLRESLLTSSYTTPQSANPDRAYPSGGWRWQYALAAAMRHAGDRRPHILSEMYAWADDMMPFVAAECYRSNELERSRFRKWEACKADFLENRSEIESQAMHNGLQPEQVKIFTFKQREVRLGQVSLRPGTWWMVGTHKVAGLSYYWQLPFEVKANEPRNLSLTEGNALIITGGW